MYMYIYMSICTYKLNEPITNSLIAGDCNRNVSALRIKTASVPITRMNKLFGAKIRAVENTRPPSLYVCMMHVCMYDACMYACMDIYIEIGKCIGTYT